MAAMFEKLDIANRLNDNNGFPYLRSHPLTVDRISEARNRTLFSGATLPPPTLIHATMQARSRVLMEDSTQSLRRHNGGTSSPMLADRVGALYAGALAASLLSEPARAQAQAKEALALAVTAQPREAAAERALGLLLAQVQFNAGQYAQTLDTLQGLGAGTRSRPVMLLRTQALLGLQRHDGTVPPSETALREATETLQTWLADQPQDAAAWEALSAVSQVLGLRLRSLRAGAESRAVLGDLTGAIDRLRAAQAVSRGAVGQDFIEASVIDVRLRQLVAQRRQIQLEARESRGGGRTGPEEAPPQ
jgi:predicted Zn-dependent protease